VSRLLYSAITSLDGYVNDATGGFDWAAPDAEVHTFVNDLERPVGTYLYGRRMYETMRAWEDPANIASSPVAADYAAIWQAAEKVVYSTTLAEVSTRRTSLAHVFDPAAVAALKERAGRDVSIGGPGLAAVALRAGLVDECRQFVVPVVVGGGTNWLPDGLRADLELLDTRRFANGVVYLRYALG
jgi:dihydrofolate reductase